jgi:hypothetical protein
MAVCASRGKSKFSSTDLMPDSSSSFDIPVKFRMSKLFPRAVKTSTSGIALRIASKMVLACISTLPAKVSRFNHSVRPEQATG